MYTLLLLPEIIAIAKPRQIHLTSLAPSIAPPPDLLRPGNGAHSLSFPLTFSITKITGNKFCILLERSLVATGIHPRYDGLPNEGDVSHPGIIPLRWRACFRLQRVLRCFAWQLDLRVLGNHPVWT